MTNQQSAISNQQSPTPRHIAIIMDGNGRWAKERGLPRIKGHPEIVIPFFLAEEHCAMKNVPPWKVGEVVELISSHACTTCNLHREFFVHDGEKVVDVWPIEAAGRLS